jgi:hypothetical protein
VAAGVVLWSSQNPTPKEIATVEMQQPANTRSVEGQPEVPGDKVAGHKNVETKLQTSGRRSKKLLSPSPVPSPQTKASTFAAPADAMLQIEVEHHFTDATASVWVDDGLVYTQSLLWKKQRHALVFRKVVRHQFQVVRVLPGRHQVRVRVRSAADSYDESRITSVAFVQGVSLLRIICDDKGEGLQLSFKKDGDR